MRIMLCVGLGGLLLSSAQADVVRSSEFGFTVSHAIAAPMPPPTAWSALSDVGRWWDSEHTYSGDARNLSLEPVVGGCFCERLGMYAGIEHMRVIYARPSKTLRLSGAMGPLQEFAVTGTLTFNIEPAAGGSKLSMTYTASGYADRPMAEWATIVNDVLTLQLQRLGRLLTSGSPDAKPEPK
jgi:hypothetical protein